MENPEYQKSLIDVVEKETNGMGLRMSISPSGSILLYKPRFNGFLSRFRKKQILYIFDSVLNLYITIKDRNYMDFMQLARNLGERFKSQGKQVRISYLNEGNEHIIDA